jgi:hypothetical protein
MQLGNVPVTDFSQEQNPVAKPFSAKELESCGQSAKPTQGPDFSTPTQSRHPERSAAQIYLHNRGFMARSRRALSRA